MKTNDFFDTLKKDHMKEREILRSIQDAKNSAPKNRETLFQKVKEELVPHMKAEENTFYQPLLEIQEARKHALEGVEEHHVSEMVLVELDAMPKDQD